MKSIIPVVLAVLLAVRPSALFADTPVYAGNVSGTWTAAGDKIYRG